ISRPVRHADRNNTFHLYPVRFLSERLSIGRDEIIQELGRCNIGTSVHFIPVHLHPYYRDSYGYAAEDIPNAARLYRELVSLPLYPAMTEEDVASVHQAVRAIVTAFRRESRPT
nr:DegT/DnrJ/EryC1/StrS aminotransferase family protein [Acidobacteriota bacterium]